MSRLGQGSPLDSAAVAREQEPEEIAIADEWDAGEMGCGEIIILLKLRMQKINPAGVLKLTARDQGAPLDLPAWCRMTGRRLLRAAHPDYWIEQTRTQ